MLIKCKAELAGRVQLQVSGGARGEIKYPWFDNLILDQGLRAVLTRASGSTQIASHTFGVGASSQEPAVTDTGLVTPIAFERNGPSDINGYNSTEGFWWTRATKIFPRGKAAGNLSEVTCSYDGTNSSAVCRALIRDLEGNPTTITVLPDEVLTVTWEYRQWWEDAESHDITYTIDDVEHTTRVSYSAVKPGDKTGGWQAGFAGSLINNTTARLVTSFSESQGNPSISNAGKPSIGATGSIWPYGINTTFNPPIPKNNEFRVNIIWELVIGRRVSQ